VKKDTLHDGKEQLKY